MQACNCTLPYMNPNACDNCPNNKPYSNENLFKFEYYQTLKSWVCPKCGNVYSEYVLTCENCNKENKK